MSDNILKLPMPVDQVSDGYHTFKELYDHRHALWMLVLLHNRDHAFKTRKNQDGKEWPGWFIAGMNTPFGQITYHLPEKLWNKLSVPERERNADYDGHTPASALKRILELVKNA